MDQCRLITRLYFCLFTSTLAAQPLMPAGVPKPLEPWVDWVLQDHQDRTCPFIYNSAGEHRCAWPSRLALELNTTQGRFAHTWFVYAESWVRLPGDADLWPQEVKVDGSPALIVEREGRPALRLGPGKHEVLGQFSWSRLPEAISIPADTGLIALTINGKSVSYPEIEATGQLWLKERDTGRKEREGSADRLALEIFRRVIDEVPLEVITRIELDAAGEQREVLLGTALLPGLIPLSLQSPLPARLELDGRLRLQLRPGHWVIELTARAQADLTQLPLSPSPPPWGDTEVWVFDARNHLRLVEIEGVASIDPRQTNLPPQWQSLPAYRLKAGDTMAFKVIRRGDPEPEPDKLSLQRELWLDFAGQGYTLHDTITGHMTRGWRLETQEPILLGQVVVDGEGQLITTLPGSIRRGIEVRRGALNLTADSRYEGRISSFLATGWDHDFQQVNAILHLPPGWRLFSAVGTDNLPNTWLQRWTLLDLFLVLIAALAVSRLWNWRFGLLALVTLALLWHEPEAPRYVWLHLLAAIALLRVLPAGRLRSWVNAYRNLSLVVLILIAIPFMVDQIRTGLYPQLERPWQAMPLPRGAQPSAPPAALPGKPAEEGRAGAEFEEKAEALSSEVYDYARRAGKEAPEPQSLALMDRLDPKAKVQTGPGLPTWRWTEVSLSWSGPVERTQKVGLVLLPPPVNLLLSLLRVALIAWMALLMLGISYTPKRGWQRLSAVLAAVCLPLLGVLTTIPSTAQAQDFPPPELLEELKTRLLKPPDCLPHCAQSPRLRLEISPESLQLRIEIHAMEEVAIPLPAHTSHWLPATVTVDGAEAAGLFRTPSGGLWLKLTHGQHQVLLAGPLPKKQSLQLPLPLKPHRVEVETKGWRVEGVHENGLADAQLQFTRLSAGAGEKPLDLEPIALPPFVRVERTLRLGLDWRVETRITRLSPRGTAVVLEVPLLQGESVTTADIRVVKGKVLVNMSPGETIFGWESVLEKRPELKLTALNSTAWTELWRVDVSPIWHVVFSGIPVVHHQDPMSRWLPEWRPWPGESVTLAITRPRGVADQTLTMDRAHLRVHPGQRATDTTLTLDLRSSQGGQHTITLPQDARLQTVTINGVAQPIRQEGHSVTLPIQPGQQGLMLTWRQPSGIRALFRTAAVDLAIPSVNSAINVGLGNDRWVLLVGGPRLGPAVLFWGVLAIIVLVSVGLGRIPLTPLKARHWLLLGIGLSQIPVWMGLIVVGWLLALGSRARISPELSHKLFDAIQLGLGLLTLVALSFLFDAISQGLLGLPEMQIAGNSSSAYDLNWYQDRSPAKLPQAWIVSVPLMVYRLLMLAWALWLAFAVLRWLRWGWTCFTTHGLWRPMHLFKRKPTQPLAEAKVVGDE